MRSIPSLGLAILAGCATAPPPMCFEKRPAPPTQGPPQEYLTVQNFKVAMAAVTPCVRSCLPRPTPWDVKTAQESAQRWSVAFSVGQDANLTDVHVTSPKKATGPIADCVIATVSAAAFPRHTGKPVEVVYPFLPILNR